MPELPEVETIKRAIEKAISKAKIEDIFVYNSNLRSKVPSELTSIIKGATIKAYRRIAKYIVIDLNNNISLIWHMGMSGKVIICDEIPNPLAKHDHIVIKTTNGVMIYNDPRRFGLFTYCKTSELSKSKIFTNTGIDPFDKDLTAAYLLAKLKTKKKTSIKTALLEQNIIAGIGNIYASEILYKSRISPLRSAESVSYDECETLIQKTLEVLNQAIKAGGSTLHDYKKPDGSLGYFQNMHCVYNKTGQKCPDCICNINKTGGIKKIVQNGRSTFYCESLQK